jgi:hypothetical protein
LVATTAPAETDIPPTVVNPVPAPVETLEMVWLNTLVVPAPPVMFIGNIVEVPLETPTVLKLLNMF